MLITVGIVLLLYTGYQLWWTNVEASRAADQAAAQLQEQWARPPAAQPDNGSEEPELGTAIALMYIPTLADSVWGTPVVQGVGRAQLAKGIGHYPATALPGEVGNFAVAAHRATNGEPFRDIDRLKAGDTVYVETQDHWFIYRLDHDQMVRPGDTWAISPVPADSGAEPTQRLITLTTCHPRWGSTQRWIWWGSLAQSVDKDTEPVPWAIRRGP